MIEGRATARYVRGSAQKAKLVLDLIRGKDVNTALATLQFCRKNAARHVSKVLRSAIANAQQQDGAISDVDRLFVGSCYANQGPSLKRIRAAPMGRAFRIAKRTSHLTVTVRERPEATVVAVTADESTPAKGARSPRRGSKATGRPKRKTAKKKTAKKKTAKKTTAKKTTKSETANPTTGKAGKKAKSAKKADT